MNLDALKKQASRLATYLGAKHRLNLKHASALEALAAVHGARNWQTLAASADQEPEDAPQDTANGVGPMTLSWHSDGRPHLTLPRASWQRHAVAFGGEAQDWVHASLAEAAAAGLQVLLFSPKHTLSEKTLGTGITSGRVHEAATLTATVANTLLAEAGAVVVSLTKSDDWVELLRQVVAQRGRSASPLVVGMPSLDVLFDEDLELLSGLFRQGRAFNLTLRAATRSLHAFRSRAEGERILANVVHQVFLGAAREDAQELLLARLQEAPAICVSADGCRF